MEIRITNKRENTITSDDVMRQTRGKRKTIPVNATDRINHLVRSAFDQFHGVETVTVC